MAIIQKDLHFLYGHKNGHFGVNGNPGNCYSGMCGGKKKLVLSNNGHGAENY